jgi:uncharacterized small protein (TIGR04563 family)
MQHHEGARKQSLYFPEDMLEQLQAEAERLDRSVSWIVQQCVRIGLHDLHRRLTPEPQAKRP